MYGKNNMETYITICKTDSQWGICCMARETQSGALYQSRGVGWGGKWEGGSKGRGYMYTYKTLESPLDCKEIQPVHSRDQSWVFIGRTEAKAETPILWPPHVKI